LAARASGGQAIRNSLEQAKADRGVRSNALPKYVEGVSWEYFRVRYGTTW